MKKSAASMTAVLIVLSITVALGQGCGDGGNGRQDADTDVTPDTPGDQDTTVDPDTTPDVPPDTPSETPPDTPTDTMPDIVPEGIDAVDGPVPCDTDEDCTSGEEWCVGGQCIPCDNSGLSCEIDCVEGWQPYERNGCHPCACAPSNACTSDDECTSSGTTGKCYAGAFCWDWCPEGDPSCCLGNICSAAGCDEPPPVGCWTRGCPIGFSCQDEGCASSGCGCDGGAWMCDTGCSGGTCIEEGD